jgi:hypothetical protein
VNVVVLLLRQEALIFGRLWSEHVKYLLLVILVYPNASVFDDENDFGVFFVEVHVNNHFAPVIRVYY